MPPRRGEIPLIPAQACPLQVRVTLVKPHRASLSDLQSLGEVCGGAGKVGMEATESGAGQEAKGQIEFLTGLPQAVHGLIQ